MRQAQQMTKNSKTDFVNIDSSDCIFDSITSVNNKSFTAKLNNYWYECDLYGNFMYKIKCQNLRRVKENLLLLKINKPLIRQIRTNCFTVIMQKYIRLIMPSCS